MISRLSQSTKRNEIRNTIGTHRVRSIPFLNKCEFPRRMPRTRKEKHLVSRIMRANDKDTPIF